MLLSQHQMRDDPWRKGYCEMKGNPRPDRGEFRPKNSICLQYC
ncbi:unnamed protein product [marine sediment metagenome]|uniref:Uncharacterized protein n=1 Tax=marine sediment metagenome TaxID=412755 RepID=X1G2N9_9ZZZZ